MKLMKLDFKKSASKWLIDTEQDPSQAGLLKQVRKALAWIETNPKYPALNTHKYHDMFGPNGQEIFESYAQNNTPSAHRIFWYYGPGRGIITIVAILPHP